MDEEELDALTKLRPFGTGDVVHWEAELRANTSLAMTLGVALWGRTAEDAQRQLLTSRPEIPAGFELAEFRKLLQWTAKMASAVLALPKMSGAPPARLPSPTVFIGPQALTLWEARREIVRRAIEYLETH